MSNFSGLPEGTLIPVSKNSPVLAKMDGQIITTGINPELARLGVSALVIGDNHGAPEPEIVYGPISALGKFDAIRQELKNGAQLKVLMHAMSTYVLPGTPPSQVKALAAALGPKVEIIQVLSGSTSFLGIDYTGNAGANYLLLETALNEKCSIVILAGGFGTRMALMEKSKAIVDIGPDENLFTNNVILGQYLWESLCPEARADRVVMLACDGKFVPNGEPCAGVRTLSSLAPEELKDVYFLSSPLHRESLLTKGFIPKAELLAAFPDAAKHEKTLFIPRLSDDSRWALAPNIGQKIDSLAGVDKPQKEALKKILVPREDPTFRFGIMMMDRYGDPRASSLALLTSGEKIGILDTVGKAKAKLRDLGRDQSSEEFSGYLNWYGFIASRQWIKDLKDFLDVIVDPATGATLRNAGNLDTYNLLLTALGIFNDRNLQDPKGTLRSQLSAELHKLLPETQIDNNFLKRLRGLLFKENGECRVGFIDFGTEALTQDVGTLADYLIEEQSLLDSASPAGALYDRFLHARELLERGQALNPDQTKEIEAVMAEVLAARNVQREVALRKCGFVPDAVLKDVRVVKTTDRSQLPLLGVSLDEYLPPEEAARIATGDGWEGSLARIVRLRDNPKLLIYNDPNTNKPLFQYDPEGIKTLRLENVVLAPGVIIGKNVGIRGEKHVIGHPDGRPTYIADGGVIIRSSVQGSFIHPSSAVHNELARLELASVLEELAQKGRGTTRDIEFPDGNVVSIAYEGTLQEQAVRDKLNEILSKLQVKQGRSLIEAKRFEEVFGLVDKSTILTIDNQKEVRWYSAGSGNAPQPLAELLNGQVRQNDPAQVQTFSVTLRKKPLPGYLIYRSDQDGQTRQISNPTLFMEIPLLTSRENVKVSIPLTFDPDKQPLALGEGRKQPVKSLEAQARVSSYKNTVILTDEQLQKDKAKEIAQEVVDSLSALPAKASLTGIEPEPINPKIVEQAIKDVTLYYPDGRLRSDSEGNILADAIVDAIVKITPDLLAGYIAQITKSDKNRISKELDFANDFKAFCDSLSITDREKRGKIRSLLESFPPAETYPFFNGLNGEGMVSFRNMVIAILTRFRLEENTDPPQAPSDYNNMATIKLLRRDDVQL